MKPLAFIASLLLCGCESTLLLDAVTAPAAAASAIQGSGKDAYESYHPKPHAFFNVCPPRYFPTTYKTETTDWFYLWQYYSGVIV